MGHICLQVHKGISKAVTNPIEYRFPSDNIGSSSGLNLPSHSLIQTPRLICK